MGSSGCGQSEPPNDIMYYFMETHHVGLKDRQLKFISKCVMLRNVLIYIPVQFSTRPMDNMKATVVLNGTDNK